MLLITMVALNCLGLCGKISFCVPLTQLYQKPSGNHENSSTGLVHLLYINLMHKKCKLCGTMCKHPTAANKLKHHTISNLVCTMTSLETKTRAIHSLSHLLPSRSWVNSVKRHRRNLVCLQNTIVTDDRVKAEMFNKYFYSIFSNGNTSNLKTLQSSLLFLSSVI